jgi:hypothetical protein
MKRFKINNSILLIFILFIFSSCIEKNRNTKFNEMVDSVSIKAKISDSIAKIPVPDNFLDFKLGTSISSFKSKYPSINQQTSDFYTLDLSLMGCGIYFDDMDRPYIINAKTKSGEKVEMSIFFYDAKLCAIYVEYKNGVFSVDKVFAAFKDKYGAPTFSEVNVNYYNTKSYYWFAESCTLNLLYKSDIGNLFLVFADKNVQNEIIKRQNKANSESIE